MATTAFLSHSPGLLNRGAGSPASLGHVPHSSIFSPIATALSGARGTTLVGAGFLYRILSPTHCTSCAPSYIIVQHPPSSCGRHKSHSFNPSTVNVIFWYSSTGCTCYLHRCISYFDCPAGSGVNIQHHYKFISTIHSLRIASLNSCIIQMDLHLDYTAIWWGNSLWRNCRNKFLMA